MELQLTYSEIKQAAHALFEIGKIPPTPGDHVIVPEGYSRAKNLKLFNRVVGDVDETASTLFRKAVEKDEEGNPRSFDRTLPDKNGEMKEARITDKKALKDYTEQIAKLNSDTHKVGVHQASYECYKKYVEEKGIDSSLLAPLLGIYIVEGDVVEGKPNA